ncbi:hypothetical protein GGR51DRAFT_562103 [Nemania sp. FL0031]|nr:hypothetical protein GGR51DRAFT_562103 [Nemania sp. FL0031]
MAVVITSEESDLFSPSTLRRSHSQSKFLSPSHRSQGFHTSASTSRIDQLFHDKYRHQSIHIVPDPSPSSGPPSPTTTVHAESESASCSSTPATSVSLDGQYDSDVSDGFQDSLLLSEYGDNPYFMLDDLGDIAPSLSPHIGESHTVSPADDASASTSRPESPVPPEHAEDDTAVKHRPTQHVDYLSHNWREEDIWSSWRYIISKRGEFANAPRLENASWRTWMKAKYGLKTVSPETLNWLKDCDVTWLYGPLQTRQHTIFSESNERNGSTLSRSDSFSHHKKPILKKRSMSEVMLQRSLSSSSLLKQAAAAVQAQQKGGSVRIGRPILHRAHTDFVTFPFSKRKRSRVNTSLLPSNATSGLASPAAERKHIHFDEQVKQCIAVDVKGDDDDDDEFDAYRWRYDDSDSDDGAIMMKTTKTGKKPIYLRKKPQPNNNSESKTIAMLPSTTLKYREDSPAPPDSAIKHSTGSVKSPTISPSLSQETLRPSKPSGSLFQFDSDDDEDSFQDDETSTISSPTEEPPRPSGLHRSISNGDLRAEERPAGMRRTESGMFMPYEEGEAQPNDGIIGRVIDTVNTARDIAHVIWNVGWRR